MRYLISEHGALLWQLFKRDIAARYRGSLLGVLWALLNPLAMLAIYTFVFGVVFKAKWGTTPGGETQAHFAVVLYSGLMLHGLLAEALSRSTTIILHHQNYVKKVVFPLEILPMMVVLSAGFMFVIQWALLFTAMVLLGSTLHATIFYAPLVLVPLLMLCLGIAWAMAALGVYIRDIAHVTGLIVTLLMFLSPIFYPISALPEEFHKYLYLNPLTLIIEQFRAVMIYGHSPNLQTLSLYGLCAAGFMVISFTFFVKTRKGFNDIL